MLYIVLLAMVAAFLALRLYSVLGKRTGHEQPLTKPAEERVGARPVARTIDMPQQPRDEAGRRLDPGAENGIRALVAADSSFDVAQFLDGSKAAYRMVLEAFWKGDRKTLEWLAGDDVRRAFESAIDEREKAGHTLDNRLVSIEEAKILDAEVHGREARVTVRFDADIAAVTRDADGNVIGGSMSDAVETHDIWTFGRTLGSDDPNWKLIETDEV
ncbi:Tim44/TimA family putative adaptor protein [Stakelama saccharophila]|uniref:Tim44/TimA family putative adaptor protein n=1 Tax=Stakelama saccharophila TaxID=3075605 RepID=A0ABZ0BD75_9SPHN|nr:Tim44/TimA family putative adaptor protein [Stakelama sp. W311]WNO55075.1 Tim44/TimA family putative adaptor protein [Stakelama sp. W311]